MKRLLTGVLMLVALTLSPLEPRTSLASAPGSQITHVIIITIDNTHLEEILQMPHLMAFLRQGTLFDNDHSVLESVSQPDMASFLSGAYPDKTGILDNNFFDRGYYLESWSYWENQAYAHTDQGTKDVDFGHNYIAAPNPWKQFNDHGWDMGVVRAPNMSLENTSEVREYDLMRKGDANVNDYIRYAMHCAVGSSNCAGASKATPSNTLFGSPNIPWLFNAPLLDGSGKVGPGCLNCYNGMLSLSATYAMQAHGIPVTYSYIEAAHGNFDPNTLPHRQVLAANDRAFELFFAKLASIGITRANTLFVITSDEGDQFAAGRERNYGLLGWLKTGTYNFVPSNFQVVDGSSPMVYMKDTEDIPLALESLGAVRHWQYLANRTGLTAIHAASFTSPDFVQREPSFIVFGETDTWWNGTGDAAYDRNVTFKHAKWDHGSLSPEVNITWLGFVGPNIQAQEPGTFVDHVDALPTIEYLLGYPIPSFIDGRILFEVLQPSALPASLASDAPEILQLAQAFKQLNAPLGAFSLAALNISTEASLHATTAQGRAEDAQLAEFVNLRNALAGQLQTTINASVQGTPLDRAQAAGLLMQSNALMMHING